MIYSSRRVEEQNRAGLYRRDLRTPKTRRRQASAAGKSTKSLSRYGRLPAWCEWHTEVSRGPTFSYPFPPSLSSTATSKESINHPLSLPRPCASMAHQAATQAPRRHAQARFQPVNGLPSLGTLLAHHTARAETPSYISYVRTSARKKTQTEHVHFLMRTLCTRHNKRGDNNTSRPAAVPAAFPCRW